MPDTAVGDTAPATSSAPPSSGAPPAPNGSSVPESSSTPAVTSDPAPKSLGQALRQASGTPGSEAPKGPIPFDRHEAILANARKEHEDYKARLAWAEQVKHEDFDRIAQLDQSLATDPVGFAQRLMLEALNDPRYAAQVRSLAGQALRGQSRIHPPAAPAEDAMPAPDADGGYTPDGIAKLLAWQQRQTLKEAEAKFGPALKTAQEIAAERQQAQQTAAIQERTNDAFQDLKEMPHFVDYADEISQRFLAMPARSEAELIRNAYRAYKEVVTPKIAGIAKQQALTDLETQARASTTRPQGGRTPQVTPGQPLRLGQAVKEAMTGSR